VTEKVEIDHSEWVTEKVIEELIDPSEVVTEKEATEEEVVTERVEIGHSDKEN
jgi:hypothetical protein